MTRERIGRLVLRCFPSQEREQRGGEMLDTMLEASSGSIRAFAFEAASLAFAGLRERVGARAPVNTAGLVAEGFRQAAVIWVVLLLTVLHRGRFTARWPALDPFELIVGAILVCWVLGYRRAAGVCGVVMLSSGVERWLVSVGVPGYPLWCLLGGCAVPFAGFVLMIAGPSPPARVLRRRAWRLPLSVIALLVVFDAAFSVPLGEVLGLGALTIVGLLLITVDPRLWIATALVWTAIGIYVAATSAARTVDGAHAMGIAIALTLAGPAAIALAYTHLQWRRRARRHRSV
jgi:hypothetical protein